VPVSTLLSLICAATAFVLFVYSLYCAWDRSVARRLAFGTGAMIAILVLSARAASLPTLLDYFALLRGERPPAPARLVKAVGPTPGETQVAVAPAPPAGGPPPVTPLAVSRAAPRAASIAAEPPPRTLRLHRPETPGAVPPRRDRRAATDGLERIPRPERAVAGNRVAPATPRPAEPPMAVPERPPARERALPGNPDGRPPEVRGPKAGGPEAAQGSDLERSAVSETQEGPATGRSDSVDRGDRREAARPERVERIERPDRRDRLERAESVDRLERVEKLDRRERLDRIERQRPERPEPRPDR
jgi:hypothetical protein